MGKRMKDLVEVARDLPAPSGVLGLPVDATWRVVRRYPATSADGHEAEVLVSRWPAMFWRVRGGGVDLSTGSGNEMARLVEAMATAIAGGMLGPVTDD